MIWLLLATFFLSIVSEQTVLYVNTNGSDQNNGSLSAPFQSIGKAFEALRFCYSLEFSIQQKIAFWMLNGQPIDCDSLHRAVRNCFFVLFSRIQINGFNLYLYRYLENDSVVISCQPGIHTSYTVSNSCFFFFCWSTFQTSAMFF